MKLTESELKSILQNPTLDRKGKNFVANCPFCGHREFGIAINLDNHPWQCYRKKHCGEAGTIFRLLKYTGKLNMLSSIRIPENRQKVEKKIIKRTQKEDIKDIEDFLNIPNISPPIGFSRIQSDKYLEERRFTSFTRYKVGTTHLDPVLRNDYVVFLIEQFGKTKGYIGRSRKSKETIEQLNKSRKEKGFGQILRYSNSPDTDFSKLLFGYDEITENTKSLIIVEGIFDKFRVDSLLMLNLQEEIKCVCTFKCKVSEEQKLLIASKKIEKIILLYDGDVLEMIKEVGVELKQEFETVLIGFHPTKDPGDMEWEDIENVMLSLTDPSSFFRNKVVKKI